MLKNKDWVIKDLLFYLEDQETVKCQTFNII